MRSSEQTKQDAISSTSEKKEKKKIIRLVNLESLHKLIEYLVTVTLLSLNMYPHEYLPLITTCHPIQNLNWSNKEKPSL